LTPPNRNTAWAQTILEELQSHGVADVVISPGSRSAPLALAAAATELRDWSVLDERSAGFFALGLARASGRAVALVCTSGTAAANYLPAVIEAHYSQVPLVLLTADRPHELRGVGAPQTIVQPGLYGSYCVFELDLPLATTREADFLQLRRSLQRAMQAALGTPPGPAHLNVGFREPLHPVRVPDDEQALRTHIASPITHPIPERPELTLSPEALDRLAERLSRTPRGWVVAGPLGVGAHEATAIGRLAEALDWPLLAEPLSQLRSGATAPTLLDASDALLRCDAFCERHAPDLVLRFGAVPTSKALNQWLASHPEIEQLVVSPWVWNEPSGVAQPVLRAEPLRLARALHERVIPATRSDFVEPWRDADRRARSLIDAELDSRSTLSEAEVARSTLRHAPPGSSVYLGNSLPVRSADLYVGRDGSGLRYFANRGASGIDGTLATALGTAAASASRCTALIGDLALLHDWSTIVLARQAQFDATIAVIDNGGGRIFESLPIATQAERPLFERHFLTPQAVDIPAALRAFDLECALAETREGLNAELARSVSRNGVQFVCARVEGAAHAEEQVKLIDRLRVEFGA